MKILMINSVLSYGSTGRIVYDLYKKSESEGHTPFVIYGRNSGADDIKSMKIGSRLSFAYHLLLTRVFDLHGFGSKLATKKLIKFIDKFNPDIIHLHNIHGYYINIEILFNYIKTRNIKTIWSLHDCWAFTGHCSHFESVNCEKWKKNCKKCEEKRSYPKTLAFDNSKKNYILKKKLFTGVNDLTILTPSDWLKNMVKQSYLGEYKVETINNGIDLSVFKSCTSNLKEKLNIKDKKVILGVASPFTDKKGFGDFIKLSQMIDENYVIILVGLNQQQIKILPNNIIGYTRTSNKQELVNLYSMADVFFNPTKEDTYPTTLMESISCGTPVVSYNIGGCSEIIEQMCGILVKKNNIFDSKDAIIYIAEKSNLFENCIDYSIKFDKNKQVQNTFDLYEKIYNN